MVSFSIFVRTIIRILVVLGVFSVRTIIRNLEKWAIFCTYNNSFLVAAAYFLYVQ